MIKIVSAARGFVSIIAPRVHHPACSLITLNLPQGPNSFIETRMNDSTSQLEHLWYSLLKHWLLDCDAGISVERSTIQTPASVPWSDTHSSNNDSNLRILKKGGFWIGRLLITRTHVRERGTGKTAGLRIVCVCVLRATKNKKKIHESWVRFTISYCNRPAWSRSCLSCLIFNRPFKAGTSNKVDAVRKKYF